MKIALPSNGWVVDGHFGHCEYFTIITVDENKKIIAQEILEPSAGCGCKSNIVEVLSNMGVTVMLAGNMGAAAVSVLQRHGIYVVRGCEGDVTKVAQDWINGAIEDSGTDCHAHEHGCQHD